MKKNLVTPIVVALLSIALAPAQGGSGQFLNVKYGYSNDYVAKKSSTYYDIKLLGKPFLSEGEAPQFSSFAGGGLADVTTRPLYLSVQRGLADIGGSLLQAYSTTPFEHFSPSLKDFNIVLGVDTQLEQDHRAAYTYGVEYKAIPFLASIRTSPDLENEDGKKIRGLPLFSSYLILGLAGQRDVDENNQTVNRDGATIRGFVGRAIYPNKKYVNKVISDQLKLNRAKYDSLDEMKVVIKTVHDAKANDEENPYGSFGDDSDLVEVLLGLYVANAPADDKAWNDRLDQKILLPPDNPTFAFWVDGNGRYSFKKPTAGPRWRSIYSLNAKYLLNPELSNSAYVQIQFMNGSTEDDPSKRKNAIIAAIGFQF